jgi:hypothetical protein
MNSTKYWLRWVAVLPVAILGGVALIFPLHWVLYLSLRHLIEPYPELPERILTPVVVAAGFIWLGAKVAPSHKLMTAWVLGGLLTIGLIAGIVFVLNVGRIGNASVSLGMMPASFVGVAIGVFVARNEASSQMLEIAS